MYYTTTRLEGFYCFLHISGKTFRTRFSPREIAHRYCFDAMDEKGQLKVVLTEEVDFKTFEYIRMQRR